ncbi:MAG TPA: 5-(carboxyamino)imidazole ribonucleotide synthase [Sphingomonas sp.]|jgi:5-(carboxyamino)imidazole ribonucleotide synthase|uniref:5-(carboxyamino)imidazole ribonucleotide synthase n=1 Tax=Sphingomonas sp. TaxID=28214 RepID=UPI002ED8525F
MILPPASTIGIVGGGQLGRMLAVAASRLGYRVHIFAPDAYSPAAEVAAAFTRAAYDDADALRIFAEGVDVATYEFENIPVATLETLEQHVPLHPSPHAIAVAQDRLAEKTFVAGLGVRVAPWAPVDDRAMLTTAIAQVGTPAILKTRRFGYDGKGQGRIAVPADADAAWDAIGERPAVLEGHVAFDREFSVLLCRGIDGGVVTWDTPDNVHVDGILAKSTVPATGIVAVQAAEATAIATRIATALDYVGTLACEFFAAPDGPVFNEMAPRVHNSGHWTIEGARTSQFENHIRAVCGLPLGGTDTLYPRVEMQNLIGDQAHAWLDILSDPAAHLHLYGKAEARPGRKMGHVTRLLE